jgi:RNA polymerase subunit RPABC4/transcription elongation factor Spt4
MNTVPCLNCHKPIHYAEGTCPHCGYVEFTHRVTRNVMGLPRNPTGKSNAS